MSVSRRPNLRTLLAHPWLDLTDEEKVKYNCEESESDKGFAPTSPGDSSPSNRPLLTHAHSEQESEGRISRTNSMSMYDDTTDPVLISAIHSSVSDKERKMYDKYNRHKTEDEEVHLPPIEPQTPNVGRARKILLRGEDLAKRISGKHSSSPEKSPHLKNKKKSSRYEQSGIASPVSSPLVCGYVDM